MPCGLVLETDGYMIAMMMLSAIVLPSAVAVKSTLESSVNSCV